MSFRTDDSLMSTRFFTNHGAQTLFAKFQGVFASNKDLAAFDALVGYHEIGGSEIFIADLTGLRPNVMIERGYALNHLHTGRLILIFNRIAGADRVPFDTSPFRYREIGEAADIPTQIRGDSLEILSAAAEGKI